MKTIRHEYLGIYIYESPKNSHELAFNKTMEEKAEIIRCRRFEEIINERYNLYDKQRLNESFIDYYEKKPRSIIRSGYMYANISRTMSTGNVPLEKLMWNYVKDLQNIS